MEKSLMNSSYEHLPGVDPENSEKGGWDTRPLASYVETFYDSLQNNIYKIISRTKLRPLNLPLLLLNVTAPLGKLLLIQKFSSLVATVEHSCWSTNPFPVAFQITLYLGKCCLYTHWTPHELLH